MPTVKQISDFIASIAPWELAESWDNVGILVDSGQEVHKVLVCLDITLEVVQEADEMGCEMIVSHHPVIFKPLQSIESATPVFLLIQKNISAICAHTNLDVAHGGVNDVLAETLELQNVVGFAELGRMGTLPKETAVKDFSVFCKEKLNTCVQLANGKELIRKVAVIGGSGGSYWRKAKEAGADCLVTGEASHHDGLDAKEQGFSLLVAGHYATEWPVTKYLQQQLEKSFTEIQIIISNKNKDPFSVI